MRVAWGVMVWAMLTGCGSGSGSQGGSGTEGNVLVPEPVDGAARVEISTQGPTPDIVLYGAQFTLRLPPGASFPSTAGADMLPAGVLQPAPSGSSAGASYLAPASADSGPVVQINIYHATGFPLGPLATLNCSVTPGAPISAGGFTLSGFSARDANGAPLTGITPRLALQTK